MSFAARYGGQCANCGERIHIDDEIERAYDPATGDYPTGEYMHADCDDAERDAFETEVDRDARRDVCTECWLLKPCGCDS